MPSSFEQVDHETRQKLIDGKMRAVNGALIVNDAATIAAGTQNFDVLVKTVMIGGSIARVGLKLISDLNELDNLKLVVTD